MENLALIDSFAEFKDDKNIDRATLMGIIEDVFRNMIIKKYGSDENFDIIVNPDKGDLEIWRNRIVVKDGEVEDDNAEIEIQKLKQHCQTKKLSMWSKKENCITLIIKLKAARIHLLSQQHAQKQF